MLIEDACKLISEAALFIESTVTTHTPRIIEELRNMAVLLQREKFDNKDKLEFMVEMTRMDHNIDMDDNGEFESESTNAMFVGWMAKTNKGFK